jgi:hypothetical protein
MPNVKLVPARNSRAEPESQTNTLTNFLFPLAEIFNGGIAEEMYGIIIISL